MIDARALLAEAQAANVTVRLLDGLPRVYGNPSPDLLAQLRAHKAEITALLRGEVCRHCGGGIDWWRPAAVALADGTGAHVTCHEMAEIERLHRAAACALAGVVATSDDGELLREGIKP